jgi:hypothetical protein
MMKKWQFLLTFFDIQDFAAHLEKNLRHTCAPQLTG